jgi:diguanylate cyclase (GGDEF)-like protein
MRALQRLDQMRQRLVDVSNELTAANQHLESLSHRDSLTGIANRRAFDFLIERQFREAARRGEPFSLALCDVDHFKAYNDRYGHLDGDECLRKVAKTLERACKRPTDVAARYGGEEFALLLPETNGEGAVLVVERARLELATLALPHAGSSTAPVVTFSAGIASFSPERDKASRDLAARADEALYRAKQLGRNRCVTLSAAAAARARAMRPRSTFGFGTRCPSNQARTSSSSPTPCMKL